MLGIKKQSNGDLVLGDFTIVASGTQCHDGRKHVILKKHSCVMEKDREKYRCSLRYYQSMQVAVLKSRFYYYPGVVRPTHQEMIAVGKMYGSLDCGFFGKELVRQGNQV